MNLPAPRSHPVRQLLDNAAGGATLTSGDIADVVVACCDGMDAKDKELWRRRLERAARAAGLARAGGEHGPARRHARAQAAELIDGLAQPWTGPPAPDLDDDQILARISRH